MTVAGASGEADLAELAMELGGPEAPLAMVGTAAVIGNLCAAELALFNWLGRSAPALASAPAVVWASSASLRAAWRAAQLAALLPVSTGLSPEEAPVAPDPALEAALEALSASGGDEGRSRGGEGEGVPERAAVWYKLLASAYSRRLEWLSPASDGQLERVFHRVAADLRAEREALPALLKLPGRGA